MAFNANVWSQLKGLTSGDLIKALTKDGWTLDGTRGAIHVYVKEIRLPSPSKDKKTGLPLPYTIAHNRVGIHYHPKNQYGAKLLTELLDDIAWTEADLRRLKLIR